MFLPNIDGDKVLTTLSQLEGYHWAGIGMFIFLGIMIWHLLFKYDK